MHQKAHWGILKNAPESSLFYFVKKYAPESFLGHFSKCPRKLTILFCKKYVSKGSLGTFLKKIEKWAFWGIFQNPKSIKFQRQSPFKIFEYAPMLTQGSCFIFVISK